MEIIKDAEYDEAKKDLYIAILSAICEHYKPNMISTAQVNEVLNETKDFLNKLQFLSLPIDIT